MRFLKTLEKYSGSLKPQSMEISFILVYPCSISPQARVIRMERI